MYNGPGVYTGYQQTGNSGYSQSPNPPQPQTGPGYSQPPGTQPALGAGGYAQQAGQQPQPQQAAPQIQVLFRPVSSYDEALLVPADVTGAITLMPHLSAGYVYTKQLDSNCNVDFAVYKRVPAQAAAPAQPAGPGAYDLRPELCALKDTLGAVQQELEELKRSGAKKSNGKAAEQ